MWSVREKGEWQIEKSVILVESDHPKGKKMCVFGEEARSPRRSNLGDRRLKKGAYIIG